MTDMEKLRAWVVENRDEADREAEKAIEREGDFISVVAFRDGMGFAYRLVIGMIDKIKKGA